MLVWRILGLMLLKRASARLEGEVFGCVNV